MGEYEQSRLLPDVFTLSLTYPVSTPSQNLRVRRARSFKNRKSPCTHSFEQQHYNKVGTKFEEVCGPVSGQPMVNRSLALFTRESICNSREARLLGSFSPNSRTIYIAPQIFYGRNTPKAIGSNQTRLSEDSSPSKVFPWKSPL